ncbi:glycosyltransferase family protein [Haloparvum sedimenti]|uniref:glycosyltransferase family protein n=1 Tax=Haloparvum sedimenti TaxID=1678448 RepID=UPI00071E7B0F|nr:glycosyltransferase [Haloparvum sedimenti]
MVSAVTTGLLSDFDVIIGNVRMGLYVGYPLAKILRTPFIGDVSDPISDIESLPDPIFSLFETYEQFILRKSDGNVFLPETIKGMSEHGITGEVAGNAVNFEQFSSPDPQVVHTTADILAKEGVDVESPIAVYLGRLVETRHIPEIIDAARRIDDWQFVIIGEGELSDELRGAADTIDNLYYPGSFQYELMPGFLSHADAGLCLVDVERPLKIFEYGAAGLPTIGGYGKLESEFSEEELIFVHPCGEEISEALHHIADNPDRTQGRVENLQKRARQHSWEEVASTYSDLIDSLSDDR